MIKGVCLVLSAELGGAIFQITNFHRTRPFYIYVGVIRLQNCTHHAVRFIILVAPIFALRSGLVISIFRLVVINQQKLSNNKFS